MPMVVLLLGCAGEPSPSPPPELPAAADEVGRRRMRGFGAYLAACGQGTQLALLDDAASSEAEPDRREVLLAWVLDAELRRSSGDRVALADLVRALGPTLDPGEPGSRAAELLGHPLPAWEEQAGASGRVDLGSALQWWGLRFADGDRRGLEPDPGASPIAAARRGRWLGR